MEDVHKYRIGKVRSSVNGLQNVDIVAIQPVSIDKVISEQDDPTMIARSDVICTSIRLGEIPGDSYGTTYFATKNICTPVIVIAEDKYEWLKKVGALEYVIWHEIGHVVSEDHFNLSETFYESEFKADKFALEKIGEDKMTKYFEVECEALLDIDPNAPEAIEQIKSLSDKIKTIILSFAQLGIKPAQEIVKLGNFDTERLMKLKVSEIK